MYKNEMEAEAWEPIIFHPFNTCPKCHGHHLEATEVEMIHYTLDINARPIDTFCGTQSVKVICPECGFSGMVGKEFIQYPDCQFRYCGNEQGYQEHTKEIMRILDIQRQEKFVGLPAGENPFYG